MSVLTPAYGRDYKSSEAVQKDYLEGKDFVLNDIASRWNGKYCSCRDFPGKIVELRYDKKRKLTTVMTP
jgi:hypothetical protein